MVEREPTRIGEPAEQLVLSAFQPGDVVCWHDARGRRVGRFVGVIAAGRRRGEAEVSIGGTLAPARLLRVPLERLRPRVDPYRDSISSIR